MSIYARTPEGYAAWRHVRLNRALRPQERHRAEYDRLSEELDLLLADLKESPTPEIFERWFKQSTELAHVAQQYHMQSVELNHSQDLC
ncbi:hypothetical protein BJV78DRAFT_1284922 [Lactifluus subvellereus]|nr:hypothetical protein BJV78DRAFT_1284922 [Lactifluus subvellereus]